MLTTEQRIQEVYIGLLGRAADPSGFKYWLSEVEKGLLSVEDFRTNLVNQQAEFDGGLGSLDRASLVNTLYQNLFGRSAEPLGLDYWVSGGGAGVSPDKLSLALSNGAGVADRGMLDKKIELAMGYYELTQRPEDSEFTPPVYNEEDAIIAIHTSLPKEVGRGHFDFSNDSFPFSMVDINIHHSVGFELLPESTPRDIIQSEDTLVGSGFGFAGVSDGVVTFSDEDKLFFQRVAAVNRAIEDNDGLGDSFDALLGESLIFDHDDKTYILISDGEAGISYDDILVTLIGIGSNSGTDQMNIVNGEVLSLF